MPVRVHAAFEVKDPAKFRELAAVIIEKTRKEPGCIEYSLFQQVNDNPTGQKFAFIECWRDQAALDEHLKMPHVKDFIEKAKDVVAGPSDLRFYKAALD